jgi:hypothetical protein
MRWARLWVASVACVGVWACSNGPGSNGGTIGPSPGTVSGTVTSSLGGGIGGVQVVVTPAGGAPLPAVQTTGGGTYSVTSVPDGAGTIAIANLSPNCMTPSPASYSGLTGTVR